MVLADVCVCLSNQIRLFPYKSRTMQPRLRKVFRPSRGGVMSHRATNWAIEQRGLKPTTKLVLWHLADRHNPDQGCFPSQQRLAHDCEISRSGLNVHLAKLEESGLIVRVASVNPETGKQNPTRYYLAFEEQFTAMKAEICASPKVQKEKPCPDSGHGTVSRKPAKPCPENRDNRVQNLDTNPVREPLSKPCVHTNSKDPVPEGFDKFFKVHPRRRDRDKCIELISAAIASGVSIAWIIQSAERYRAENKGNKSMYVAYADNWLEQKRWRDHPMPKAKATPEACASDLASFWAEKIRNRAHVPSSAVSAPLAQAMVRQQLVTHDELRSAGIFL
jgi:DNA-binding MarR family transcriptional regulator